MLKLGVHAGPQNLSMEELMRLWRLADEAGFHWISVWDHFYANPLRDRNEPCFEAVATMAALAAVTRRARIGCLMFCGLFRNPALLAKSAVTIDHVSGGRAEIGIGGGWLESEFTDFGYRFDPLGRRLDELEEVLAIVRSLWRDERTDFDGRFHRVSGGVCSPKPLQQTLPLWVGGFGARRTPRLAARFADGYNLPYLSPELVAERLRALHEACEETGRDPRDIDTSVNLHFAMSVPDVPEAVRAGTLYGGAAQVRDRLGAYAETGVAGVNLAFRAPIDWDAVEDFVTDVLPAFLPMTR